MSRGRAFEKWTGPNLGVFPSIPARSGAEEITRLLDFAGLDAYDAGKSCAACVIDVARRPTRGGVDESTPARPFRESPTS